MARRQTDGTLDNRLAAWLSIEHPPAPETAPEPPAPVVPPMPVPPPAPKPVKGARDGHSSFAPPDGAVNLFPERETPLTVSPRQKKGWFRRR